MAILDQEAAAKLATTLANKLEKRAHQYRLLDGYYEGNRSNIPQVIRDAKLTKAYDRLMPLARDPWGSLIVDSKLDRLEVSGIRDTDSSAADAVWGVWQDNQMDSESKLAHSSALISGRAFALVWPDPDNDDQPEISLDSSEQMIVQYREGSRRHRVAALRQWCDDDGTDYATLYRADALYKFRKATEKDRQAAGGGSGWVPRTVLRADGTEEPWPLPNEFGVVPAVEIPVNRRLKPGQWGWARGEYEHCLGTIDRIHLLTFLGLVVAFWLGFPLRGVIGDKILRDDDNNPLPPFNADPGEIAQIENPDAKFAEYKAADRSNLSIFDELAVLSALTKMPRHYFPLAPTAHANISADAIRADEGTLNANITGHKGSVGEGWEEVLRVGGLMLPTPVKLSPRAELVWRDHESRSLAERADAAVKLKDILPWQALAEKVLNATQGEISRWQGLRASDAMGQILAAAAQPSQNGGPPPQEPVGAGGPAGREPAPPRGNEPRV